MCQIYPHLICQEVKDFIHFKEKSISIFSPKDYNFLSGTSTEELCIMGTSLGAATALNSISWPNKEKQCWFQHRGRD